MAEGVTLAVAYLVGGIPVSNLFARLLRNADLRQVDVGTVSATGLYRITGFGPLATAGLLDIAKGAVGPVMAGAPGTDRPVLAALSAGAAVAGHNWSPFLRFAGGRGLSPAMGALAVIAWPGMLVLLAGLGFGKLADHTGLGSFVALLVLVPVVAVTHGATGALAGIAVVTPMLIKRMLGNAPMTGEDRGRVIANRLLYDRDRPEPS